MTDLLQFAIDYIEQDAVSIRECHWDPKTGAVDEPYVARDIADAEAWLTRAKHCELIHWIAVTEYLPDDEVTVLMYAPKSDEPVWLGYYGDMWGTERCWTTVGGDRHEGVTHWANVPHGLTK